MSHLPAFFTNPLSLKSHKSQSKPNLESSLSITSQLPLKLHLPLQPHNYQQHPMLVARMVLMVGMMMMTKFHQNPLLKKLRWMIHLILWPRPNTSTSTNPSIGATTGMKRATCLSVLGLVLVLKINFDCIQLLPTANPSKRQVKAQQVTHVLYLVLFGMVNGGY